MLHELPWQEIATGLIVLIALGHVTRRWWPGRQAKGACHDTGGGQGAPNSGGCGAGGCADCSNNPGGRQAPPLESEIRIHRSKPQ